MRFTATTSLYKIKRLRKRLRICQGGARAGKTIAILTCLIDLAQSHPNLVMSVVSETMPHLKRGAMRDFENIMRAHGYWREASWNKSNFTYTFENGTILEFFSADSPDRLRGPARDILFINECNNVTFESYRQLAMRTSKVIYLDFNPVAEFWVHTELINRKNAEFVKLTYRDNEAIPKAIKQEILELKKYPNLWRIYGLGEIGINEGQVYDNWVVDELETVPEDAQLVRRGLDFGFTNDPAALVDIYKWNGGFIIDELAYAPRLKNRPLANIIRKDEGLDPLDENGKFIGRTKVRTIGDSSEPKSIAEIEECGVYIAPAVKGPDSVNYGIEKVQEQKIWVTKRSLNVIKEYRNYTWKKDKKTEKWLTDPIDLFNHAMDAIRYAITDLVAGKEPVFRVRRA